MVSGSRRLLTSLDLWNFRAFEAQHVEFGPITVFVGPNNAGKSSILSAIRVLSQTVQSADWDVPLLLGEFGTFRDIAYANKTTRIVGIGVGFKSSRGRGTVNVKFKYRGQRREIVLRGLTICDGKQRVLFKSAYVRRGERQAIESLAGMTKELIRSLAKRPLRLHHFLPRVANLTWEFERRGGAVIIPFASMRQLDALENLSRDANRLLQSVQYIGPFRETPLRVYPFSGERPSGLGPTGSGATDVLVADFFRRGSRKRELSGQVRDWLSAAEISDALEVRALSDRHYDLRLRHPETHEMENLRDVGFGISQVLPVLVAGYNSHADSLFIVEEPEIHLHPRAQAELGDFFLQLYQKNVQCVVETHSEHLIMRLQRHVASGDILPGDLVVNYVTARKGVKAVIRLPLNANGIFEKKWPHGFFEERMHEALELARAPLHKNKVQVERG